MTKVTKTLNPLHFEDLEPHRFEDLVRQLIYDFKNWKSLEATGRSGSDNGFDVRGWENDENFEEENEIEDEDKKILMPGEDKIWLIQCKREKSITPSKIKKYFENIKEKNLYGLIFVASCNLSKKTRDTFIDRSSKLGCKESYIWSGSELEDMLFQPKNDHLLFAYFGISLIIRRRTLKSQIRQRIVVKNKIINYLGGLNTIRGEPVLIRDINDRSYPFIENKIEFKKNPRWRLCDFHGHYYNGIKVLLKKYFAYLDYDKKEWDYVNKVNDAILRDDLWLGEDNDELRNKVWRYWSYKIKVDKQASLEVYGIIPYEKIVEIDKNGDLASPFPHIYIDAANTKLFEFQGAKIFLAASGYHETAINDPDIKKE